MRVRGGSFVISMRCRFASVTTCRYASCLTSAEQVVPGRSPCAVRRVSRPDHLCSMKSYIYVISATGSRVKIGYSHRPQDRLCNLRSSSPVDLHLEFVVAVRKARDIEQMIHRDLDHCRTHGEWFEISVEAAIAAVEARAGKGRRLDPNDRGQLSREAHEERLAELDAYWERLHGPGKRFPTTFPRDKQKRRSIADRAFADWKNQQRAELTPGDYPPWEEGPARTFSLSCACGHSGEITSPPERLWRRPLRCSSCGGRIELQPEALFSHLPGRKAPPCASSASR